MVEYKILYNPSEGQLNELAEQGWRVVGVGGDHGVHVVMERDNS